MFEGPEGAAGRGLRRKDVRCARPRIATWSRQWPFGSSPATEGRTVPMRRGSRPDPDSGHGGGRAARRDAGRRCCAGGGRRPDRPSPGVLVVGRRGWRRRGIRPGEGGMRGGVDRGTRVGPEVKEGGQSAALCSCLMSLLGYATNREGCSCCRSNAPRRHPRSSRSRPHPWWTRHRPGRRRTCRQPNPDLSCSP